MKTFATSVVFLLLCAIGVKAQNPIIHDQFTADPTARVFNGKVYLYPSHDIPSPVNRLKEWFCMADYHVFSSDNLTDWHDHGVILSQENVPWGNPEAYSMWAPDCVEKNGKYYFYFPDAPRDTTLRGFNIGVAISDRPDGGFVPQPEPIKGVFGIDPCVLQDDDGEAYIYWAAGIISGAKLSQDMTNIATEPQRMEGLPKGFVEGPFAFKHAGKYYLTFPWVEDSTETLAYCMSDKPLGPWKFCGKIMEQSPTVVPNMQGKAAQGACWTNHHSIVNFKGQWYLFYHHDDFSPQFDKNRSVRIDKLYFNSDGTIQPVQPTLRGVGITNAFERIQIDRYSAINSQPSTINPHPSTLNTQPSTLVSFLDENNPFEGWKTTMSEGGWVEYNDIWFSAQPQMVLINARSDSGSVARILLDGNCVARIAIPARQHFESEIKVLDKECRVSANTKCNLRVEMESGTAEIDYVQFCAQMPVVQTKFTADPAPMVHDGKVFLYTTHDEDDARGYEFKMKDWLLYTSEDMVNWEDHGAVASLSDFHWYDGDNGAWAEQVIERNGKFYMYCPIHGHGIGVLVADSPYGPFSDPIGKPLVWQRDHWYDIDPTVWIDSDGQAYMFWGNPHTYYVKLNEDMISTSGEIVKLPHINDYQEGPWVYFRGGKWNVEGGTLNEEGGRIDGHYYLAFASTCCPEGIGYAMSDKITGPWEYKGHIMNHTYKTRGNHPGIIDYKGHSYVLGLNYDILRLMTDEHSERRSVSCAEMHYNSDGTIQELPYFRENSLDAISTFNPFRKVEAETMAWGYGLKTRESATFPKTISLHDIDNGEWMMLRNVDFGKRGARKFLASVASLKAGSTIEIRLDNADGKLVGTLAVPVTRSLDSWQTASCKLKGADGVHDLFFVFRGTGTELFQWDWWQMK